MKKKLFVLFWSVACLLGICAANFSIAVSAAESNYFVDNMRIRRRFHHFSTRSHSGSSELTSSEAIFGLIIFGVFIFIVLVAIIKTMKDSNNRRRNQIPAVGRTVQDTLNPMSTYNEINPYFEMMPFCNRVSEMYIDIQNAQNAGQLYSVHDYFTNECFADLNQQMNALKRAGKTEYMDCIKVMLTKPLGWKKVENDEIITVQIIVRMINYIVQNATERVISGSKTEEYIATYEWIMVREGHQAEETLAQRTHCPCCGASCSHMGMKKCAYCGYVFELPDDVWLIQNMKRLSFRKAQSI